MLHGNQADTWREPRPHAFSTMLSAEGFMPAVVSLAFAGGLVPSLISANKIAFANLNDPRPELEASTIGQQSGSPPLSCSALLGYPAPVTELDVVDVLTRVSAADAASMKAILSQPADGSRRLVRKAEFSLAISRLRPLCKDTITLVSSSGHTKRQLRQELRSIGNLPPAPLAVDATWAALSANAPYVSPEEVERCFARWRPDATTLAIEDFERELLQGRATVVVGYTILFGIQILVASLLFLQPLLDGLRQSQGE